MASLPPELDRAFREALNRSWAQSAVVVEADLTVRLAEIRDELDRLGGRPESLD